MWENRAQEQPTQTAQGVADKKKCFIKLEWKWCWGTESKLLKCQYWEKNETFVRMWWQKPNIRILTGPKGADLSKDSMKRKILIKI